VTDISISGQLHLYLKISRLAISRKSFSLAGILSKLAGKLVFLAGILIKLAGNCMFLTIKLKNQKPVLMRETTIQMFSIQK
jgi:hypothetical protein